MGTSQTKAQNKYISKRYDRINLLVEKGEKDKIKAHADSLGLSLNAFINQAIERSMDK